MTENLSIINVKNNLSVFSIFRIRDCYCFLIYLAIVNHVIMNLYHHYEYILIQIFTSFLKSFDNHIF